MLEIYLIEILESICFGLIIAAIACCITAFIYANIKDNLSAYNNEEIEKGKILSKKIKKCLCVAIVFFALFIFTPSTRTAYMILGVGGTIDYLRKNETAKQLPDKCIKALDAWVDEINPKEFESPDEKIDQNETNK